MGSDKGLVRYRDQTLIEHALHLIEPFCSEILISANSQAYEGLGYRVIYDEIGNIGPLGGIYSCIAKAKHDRLFVTACDMPEIKKEFLKSLIESSEFADVVFLILPSGKLQSLPLILNKKVQPYIKLQIDNKEYAMHSFISACITNEGIKSEKVMIGKEPKNVNSIKDLNYD